MKCLNGSLLNIWYKEFLWLYVICLVKREKEENLFFAEKNDVWRIFIHSFVLLFALCTSKKNSVFMLFFWFPFNQLQTHTFLSTHQRNFVMQFVSCFIFSSLFLKDLLVDNLVNVLRCQQQQEVIHNNLLQSDSEYQR